MGNSESKGRGEKKKEQAGSGSRGKRGKGKGGRQAHRQCRTGCSTGHYGGPGPLRVCCLHCAIRRALREFMRADVGLLGKGSEVLLVGWMAVAVAVWE